MGTALIILSVLIIGTIIYIGYEAFIAPTLIDISYSEYIRNFLPIRPYKGYIYTKNIYTNNIKYFSIDTSGDLTNKEVLLQKGDTFRIATISHYSDNIISTSDGEVIPDKSHIIGVLDD